MSFEQRYRVTNLAELDLALNFLVTSKEKFYFRLHVEFRASIGSEQLEILVRIKDFFAANDWAIDGPDPILLTLDFNQDFSENDYGPELIVKVVDLLSCGLYAPGLVINFSNCRIGDNDFRKIVSTFVDKKQKKCSFIFDGNEITDIVSLYLALRIGHVADNSEFSFFNNRITDLGFFHASLTSTKFPSNLYLNFGNNQIDQSGFESLTESIRSNEEKFLNKNLWLNLSGNKLVNQAIASLASVLVGREKTNLKINFSNNPYTMDGVRAVYEALTSGKWPAGCVFENIFSTPGLMDEVHELPYLLSKYPYKHFDLNMTDNIVPAPIFRWVTSALYQTNHLETASLLLCGTHDPSVSGEIHYAELILGLYNHNNLHTLKLDLSRNYLANDTVLDIAHLLSQVANYKKLDLVVSDVSLFSAISLFSIPSFINELSLKLLSCEEDMADIENLAKEVKFASLLSRLLLREYIPPVCSLDFTGTPLTTWIIKNIFETLARGKCRSVLTLNFTDTSINFEGARSISAAIQNENFPTNFTLTIDNKIALDALDVICEALKSEKCPAGLKIKMAGAPKTKLTGLVEIRKIDSALKFFRSTNVIKYITVRDHAEKYESSLGILPREIRVKILEEFLSLNDENMGRPKR